MRAVSWTRYGKPNVLKIIEVKKPTPKKNEVLIKVHLSTVTSGDVRLRSLKVPLGFKLLTRLVFGLFKPKKQLQEWIFLETLKK